MTLSPGQENPAKIRKIHWEFYDDHTPLAIVKFFEARILMMEQWHSRFVDYRYRFFYGDPITGALNESIGPDEGYVTLAGGRYRFMLLYNSNSTQGPGIMLRNIIKIERCTTDRHTTQRVVYRHPNYHKATPDELAVTPSPGNIDTRQASRIVIRKDKQ
jgi:hypothetical protein